MSYQLKADEILEALAIAGAPRAAELTAKIEAATNEAAQYLAEITGTIAGVGDFQSLNFAGLCVPFHPAHEGQAIPDCMAGFDADDEWIFDGADLMEASDGFTCQACGRAEWQCSASPCEAVERDREV